MHNFTQSTSCPRPMFAASSASGLVLMWNLRHHSLRFCVEAADSLPHLAPFPSAHKLPILTLIPASLLHTYLVATRALTNALSLEDPSALHSAARSFYRSLSGALAAQFLMVYHAVACDMLLSSDRTELRSWCLEKVMNRTWITAAQ